MPDVENPVWLAPELLLKRPFGVKADIYSFGVILWELVHRKQFFGDLSFMSEISENVRIGFSSATPLVSSLDLILLLPPPPPAPAPAPAPAPPPPSPPPPFSQYLSFLSIGITRSSS